MSYQEIFEPPAPLPISVNKLIKAKFDKHHTAFAKIEKQCSFLAGDKFNFVQCSDKGVNVQAGVGQFISLQTMGIHGPFHMQMIWPLTLLAGPLAMPQQIPFPPYMPILPDLGPFCTVLLGCACWVAEELYGKNDIRTHHARLYTMVHDNFFTRLYKKYGLQWATLIKRHTWIKTLIKPIWNYMAFKGKIVSKNFLLVAASEESF